MTHSPRSLATRLFAAFGIFSFAALILLAISAVQVSGATPSASAMLVVPTTTESLPPGAVITTVLPNMNNPIAMVFDQSGRLFYTEKVTGNVRLFANGVLQAVPVINFSVSSSSERGLLGITLDPDFASSHYIYVYYTASSSSEPTCSGGTENRVVRFVENNGVGSNPTRIFFSCQSAGNHNGGNIHFGQDGKLYISVGDNANAANSQNVAVTNGKIHRINSDGSMPADNPVFTGTAPLPSLFAKGVRNTFDFAIDPLTAPAPWPRIFASENGPNCDDEMNRIQGGNNYGWRAGYPCDDANPDPLYNTIPPLWYLPSSQCCQAPTGVEVYTGTLVPTWQNDLFMCTYSNGALRHFYLSADRTVATNVATVSGVTCNMDIVTGPDGAFYYMEGGGYTTGILKKITVPGGATATATTTATATNTLMPMPSATNTTVPPSPTDTATTAPTQTPGGNTATPVPTQTNTVQPTDTAAPATSTVIPTATACTLEFQDVLPGNTFYPFVKCLACQGILNGYPCGGPGEPCVGGGTGEPYFRPGNNVTRGQIAKIVSNAGGYDFMPMEGTQTFEDVVPGSTFYLYIERLAFYNIMAGYPCGSPEPCIAPGDRPYFRPSENATRGQIAKIVSNAAGFDDDVMTPVQTFEDVPPGSTFYLFVERLILNRPGVMSGYPCGGATEPCVGPNNRPYFRPNSSATRGQLSKIVSNTFFPDCVVPVQVKIEEFAYHPADITIHVGTTVRFVNRDLDYHTATAVDASFNTGHIQRNQFVDVTFNAVGDHEYFCEPHPYMRGFVHVIP
ncbi:MAG: PQQ-dependent sugar dehydrogenase [Chloroflexota bacterium]